MRWALRFVAESRTSKLTATIDQMLRGIDAMAPAVREGGRRFADAGTIRAVHGAVRQPRKQRALDLFLQIDDDGVAIAPEAMAEGAELDPGVA